MLSSAYDFKLGHPVKRGLAAIAKCKYFHKLTNMWIGNYLESIDPSVKIKVLLIRNLFSS